MASGLPSLEVLGVRVARLTAPDALQEVERLHQGGAPAMVAYVNAHTLNLSTQRDSLREALNRAALVLNDGSGLSLAAKLQGTRFPDNLNGTDFTPRVLALAAKRGWRVFFLGAKPGVAEAAARVMVERLPGLQVAGTHDGHFPPERDEEVAARVRASAASLILVAMGNPRQEEWLTAHLDKTGCRLGMGVGAFFDFAAGNVPRAPAWMRGLGVEWMYRLVQEPSRMWRRYVLGNPLFVGRILAERLRGPRASG
jgi:exopolysaccharide biosynthesis WecB/TagA/CpsF family protein